MTAATLDMFSVVAVDKNAPQPEFARVDREQAYIDVANTILAMHRDAERVADAVARAKRIAARLDDPGVAGTPEQRGQAEARHYYHVMTARRITNDHLRHYGRIVSRAFGEMTKQRKQWVLDDARACHDSPLWSLVDADQYLGRDPVWLELMRAAALGPVNREECPF